MDGHDLFIQIEEPDDEAAMGILVPCGLVFISLE